MSAFDENYDDDTTADEYGSDLVRELRKANKAKEKQLRELQDQLVSIQKQSRERTVKDVLTSRGLNPKIAAFIPADIDPSEEAVASWVEQYADIFGGTAAAPAAESTPEEIANLSALGQINAVQQSATPLGGDPKQIESLIRGAQSPEELNRLLYGNPTGPAAF
jgi:hypothetical protein